MTPTQERFIDSLKSDSTHKVKDVSLVNEIQRNVVIVRTFQEDDESEGFEIFTVGARGKVLNRFSPEPTPDNVKPIQATPTEAPKTRRARGPDKKPRRNSRQYREQGLTH